MSCDGSNDLFSPACRIPFTCRQRSRLAPAAINLGTMVLLAVSSEDQIRTLPLFLQRVPSGQYPPFVIVAASDKLNVLLLTPTSPPKIVSLPSAIQYFQSHDIGSGAISEHRWRRTSSLLSSKFSLFGFFRFYIERDLDDLIFSWCLKPIQESKNPVLEFPNVEALRSLDRTYHPEDSCSASSATAKRCIVPSPISLSG